MGRVPTFADLFSAGGPEIGFRKLGDLGIEPGDHAFEELQRLCRQRGETALGILHHDAASRGNGRLLELNPRRGVERVLSASDEMVVMSATRGWDSTMVFGQYRPTAP